MDVSQMLNYLHVAVLYSSYNHMGLEMVAVCQQQSV